MTVTLTEVLTSAVPDVGGVPLDEELGIGGADYARIMRRIGAGDGETAPSVSAFNSSI